MKNLIKISLFSALGIACISGCNKKETAEESLLDSLKQQAASENGPGQNSGSTKSDADSRTSVTTDKRSPVMSVVGPRTYKEPVKVHVNKNDAVTIGIFSYGDNRERKLRVLRDGKPWSDPLTQRNRTVKFKLSEPGDYELYPAELTYDESKEIPMDSLARPGVSNSYADGGSEMAFLGYTDYHYHGSGPNRGLIVVIMDSDFDRMLPGTIESVAIKRAQK
jgi:hypothetical protein